MAEIAVEAGRALPCRPERSVDVRRCSLLVILITEDHTGWPAVVLALDQDGLGFAARRQVASTTAALGDSDMAAGHPRLWGFLIHSDDAVVVASNPQMRVPMPDRLQLAYNELVRNRSARSSVG